MPGVTAKDENAASAYLGRLKACLPLSDEGNFNYYSAGAYRCQTRGMRELSPIRSDSHTTLMFHFFIAGTSKIIKRFHFKFPITSKQ